MVAGGFRGLSVRVDMINRFGFRALLATCSLSRTLALGVISQAYL